jgi:hypothetical protein
MGSGQMLWNDKGIWSMHIFPSVQAAFISSLGFCNDNYKQVAEMVFPSVSRSLLGSCCSWYSLTLNYLRPT